MDIENKIYKCFRIKKRKENKTNVRGENKVYESYQALCKINGQQYTIRLKGKPNTFFHQIDEYIKEKKISDEIEKRLTDLRENLVL